jgi:hypothetical protein
LDSKSHAGSDVLTVGVLGGIVIILSLKCSMSRLY